MGEFMEGLIYVVLYLSGVGMIIAAAIGIFREIIDTE